MDSEAITRCEVLERMLLDEDAKPMQLSLSLLKDITNRFSPTHEIGKGGFAVVYKGIVGKGFVAVKKLTNTFNMREDKFHEEVKCLIKAKHKNVVRFLGYCSDTQGKMEDYEGMFVMADQRSWLLCFEYARNGALDNHITDASRGLNWRVRYRIIKGICEGLLFLHEKRILHLDLKPANILLDHHMTPKITDFGLSRSLGEEQTRAITENICGTRGYMDPEYLRTGQIAFASDIYSLGVIIMEILTGVKGYFEAENVFQSWMIQLEASEGDELLKQVRVCYNIGIECMDLDPKKRPLARHIVNMLDKTVSADNSDETIPCPLWGVQDHGTSNSISMSTGLHKLKYVDICDKKRHMNFDRKAMIRLKKSRLVRIFRKEEVEPILRSGNLIGKSDLTEVYKGVIGDAVVAVKKLINGNVLENEQLVDEIFIQSQVIHKNIVRLIGCCVEMDVPILVYEFMSKGSMDDILHKVHNKEPLNLDVRLGIVAESASGLYYMTSQAHTMILHGDVKPANILLDDNFLPKISNIGMSRMNSRDKQRPTFDIADIAYMDPVFLQRGLLSEKSDVYSFGVVILEVISRKKATFSDSNNLVRSFLQVHGEGKKATQLFDKEIAVTTGDLEILDCLAEIAVECLNLNLDERPMMGDIAERLLMLNRSRRSKVV